MTPSGMYCDKFNEFLSSLVRENLKMYLKEIVLDGVD
jgi:hypothetical protein